MVTLGQRLEQTILAYRQYLKLLLFQNTCSGAAPIYMVSRCHGTLIRPTKQQTN